MCVARTSQRVPKLQAEDQAVWWDTLNKMQKLLRKAAASLHTAGKFDKDITHNYFMSGKSRSLLSEIFDWNSGMKTIFEFRKRSN